MLVLFLKIFFIVLKFYKNSIKIKFTKQLKKFQVFFNLSYLQQYQLLVDTSKKSNSTQTIIKKNFSIFKWNPVNIYNYKIRFVLKASFKFYKNSVKKKNNFLSRIRLISKKISFKKNFFLNIHSKNLNKPESTIKTFITKNNSIKKNHALRVVFNFKYII